ncbi:MAG TPA: serine hydrolase domain-containing protein [Candidatus Acidoferrales bacterium]|nr:serine hydrolase domain-containing protein [Candidatus Acidoferrales bacterium]
MITTVSRRRFMGVSAGVGATLASSRFFALDSYARTPAGKYEGMFAPLDAFVEQYMRDMNAPGMTLVLADRDGVQRVVTYGWSDMEGKAAVQPGQIFQIGSISKSFLSICLLQLRDEGKLDLHKPIAAYMPWLRIDSAFAPITTHHMLTHSSGLPSIPPVFLSDPAQKHRAAYAPGEHFHYCNMAFTALGHLLWTLDGRNIGDAIRQRVFEPLGMTQSEPVITLENRPRQAKNYNPFQGDRPYPRNGRLSEAPAIITTEGAGCIAATPRDMGLYVQMIANRGQGRRGRLLSEEGFGLFSQAHIQAEEFGPTASYGYGIAVDTLDGHKILRHTGGMVSFASSMHVDLDEGVGAFASINAMQGYRPNPVAQYAIRLMRAQREGKPLPTIPPPTAATRVEDAAEYAGVYQSADGRTLEFVAADQALFLLQKGKRVPLEGGGGRFIVLDEDFARFSLAFGRADAKDPKSPVVEVGWGSDWFVNAKYSGPNQFDYPKEWDSYAGHYRNESAWIGSLRILVRKGKLLLDGVVPLEPAPGGVFYLRDEPYSPEWIRFGEVVNGKAMRIKLSGEDMWRVMTA